MSHTDDFEGDIILLCFFCVYLDLLNICYYNMTKIRFIMMINSQKATKNVSVWHLKMSVCDTKTAQKDTLLGFYSYILLTIPLLSH